MCERLEDRQLLAVIPGINFSTGTQLTTYTLALATTAEFTQAAGGAAATSTFLNNFVNELNNIYEREVALRFVLHPQNNQLIFTDAATDGYTNGDNGLMIDENTPRINTVLNGAVGNDSGYDLGHVLGIGTDGGLAGTGKKGTGASNLREAVVSSTWVGLVAHEIGHQLSADHTFNGVLVNCSQRAPADAYEPGAGLSIMSYAGTCGGDNLPEVAGKKSFFHANSLSQMLKYTTQVVASRGTRTNTGNTLPTVNAGADRTIPANTPFALTAAATDADAADSLTYTWDQIDSGGSVAQVLQAAAFTVNGQPATPTNTLNQLDQTTAAYVDGDRIVMSGVAPDGNAFTTHYTYRAGDTLKNLVTGSIQDPPTIATAVVKANNFIGATAYFGPRGQILVEAFDSGTNAMSLSLQSDPADGKPASGITTFNAFNTIVAGRTDPGGASVPISNARDGRGPLFATLPPSSDATRTFPLMSDILANTPAANNKLDHLPTQARDLNFRATVRDNHLFNGRTVSGIVSDDVKLTVVDTGAAFQITSHNAANQTLAGGSQQTITWDVAGTTSNGINTNAVDILMSVDGGLTYPVKLATQTANDGTETITLPNLVAAKARFKVQADPAQNVFFDVNNADFAVTFDAQAPGVLIAESNGNTRLAEGQFTATGLAATDTYQVSLSQTPNSAVEITITAASQVQVSIDGTTFAASQKLTFAAGDAAAKTVTVRAINDTVAEGAHAGLVRHAITASADARYSPTLFGADAIQTVNAMVSDDESPPLIGFDLNFAANDETPANWSSTTDAFAVNFTNMVREGGATTNVDLAVTLNPACCNAAGTGTSNINALSVPRHAPNLIAVGGQGSWENVALTATWSDLQPSTKYRVYVFAVGAADLNQQVTITGSGADNPAPFTQNGTGKLDQLLINGSVGSNTSDLEQFAHTVTSTADGKMNIAFARNGNNVQIAGLAIQEFFETPAGFTLVESGGRTEATEGGATDSFTVVLDSQPANDVVLNVTSANTAEATADKATLTFTAANWNVAQTVTVTAVDDAKIDGDQTTNITVAVNAAASDARYANVTAKTVSATTKDNDVAGFTIAETGGKTEVNETGTTDTFTVVLNAQPAANVVLKVTSSRTTEATAAPATLTFTAANWNQTQTVTVTGVEDNVVDGNQTITVGVAIDVPNSSTDFAAVVAQNVNVTVIDSGTGTGGRIWQNPLNRLNVDNNVPGSVDPIDALIVINEINLRRISDAQGRLPTVFSGTNYYDVDGDGFVAPVDALLVINHINARLGGGPEGESASGAAPVVTQAAPVSAESQQSQLRAAVAAILFDENLLPNWFDTASTQAGRRRFR